jgi:RimJ/RimL family protein N-acetyltransferase
MITFRKAEINDQDMLLEWRNHLSIRKSSFNSALIDRETHEQWYQASLNNSKRIMVIVVKDQTNIGLVRFDLSDVDPVYEIHIYLAPEWQGKNLGLAALLNAEKWFSQTVEKDTIIIARVKESNKRSIQMFESAGYSKTNDYYEKTLSGADG